MTKLSTAMQAAYDTAVMTGGLKRLPGGFWVGLGAADYSGGYHGTQTVRALVARNFLVESRYGQTYTTSLYGQTYTPSLHSPNYCIEVRCVE